MDKLLRFYVTIAVFAILIAVIATIARKGSRKKPQQQPPKQARLL